LPAPPLAERIAVIRLGAVGDVVRTLPAVSVLRTGYPDAHITWIVESGAASLLEAQPWIDEVLVFPRTRLVGHVRAGRVAAAWHDLRAFLVGLRSRRFRMVVDFHSILKSGVLSRASGAPIRVAYAHPYGREGAWLFANARARLAPERCSRFVRNAALTEYLGFAHAPHPQPLHVPDEVRTRMAAALGGGDRPIVVLHPGTSDGTPHKRFPPEGYAAVARALRDRCAADVRVSVGPARDDRRLAEAIVAGADGAARVAPTTASLLELAGLFAESQLYVGSDTGPMHVASLVGTPVVQILGPTDPVENAPYDATPSRTVRVPVACSPCRRGCSAATCMRVIPPARVVDAARALLAPAESVPPARAGAEQVPPRRARAEQVPPRRARAEQVPPRRARSE
jgi:ADP-heptose:LPS heptosyltransferase